MRNRCEAESSARARKRTNRAQDRSLNRARVAMPMTRLRIVPAILLVPASSHGQVMTLREVLDAAAANNRAIRRAELQREKAVDDLRIARTRRLPVFSATTLALQPITLGGVTLAQGAPSSSTCCCRRWKKTTAFLVDVEDGLIRWRE